MADQPPISIPALELLLQAKKSRLEELVDLREQLQRQFDDLDRQMYDQACLQPPKPPPRPRRPGKPKLVNAASLRAFIVNVLKQHRKGLLIADLAEKILEAGYQTQADNFHMVVYQSLYHMTTVERDPQSRRYTLKKSTTKGR